MAKCININHPDYIDLLQESGLHEDVLKAKISIWMEENGEDRIPALEELAISPLMPVTQERLNQVQELFESNPELANSVYEALGFNNEKIVETAKGSTYKYLSDGKTQRFKKVENKEYEPQDILTFVPNYDWIKSNNPKWLKQNNLDTEIEYEQYILNKVQGKDKVWIIDSKGNKIETNQKAKETDKIFIAFGTEDGKVQDYIPVSKDPVKGFYTYDSRIYKNEKGERTRQRHLGNKVVDVRHKELTPQQKATAQQLYSQYLQQNPNGSVEGFKSWVSNNQSNVQFQKLTAEEKAKTIEQPNTLFGLNIQNQEQLEFHINTLNVVSQFLENIGIDQRLVSDFLNKDGSIVDGALAAANFIEGTVDIIDDLDKGRAEAWNKLPEEAAHWWYRLLNENSSLKKALWESHQTTLKNNELYKTQYGKLVKSPSDLTEESIGQLIAEAIKRIETKNANASDYSFFKKFLDWINSIIDIFKTTTQDPFEVAAMKILSSDMSDLMTLAEYRKINNIVNFADVLTEQSVAPIDYTMIEDLGSVQTGFKNLPDEVIVGQYFSSRKANIKSSPIFETQQELDNWVFANIKEYDQRQKAIIQEVKDNQQFFDRLLNKSFRKKSKYLPKTLRKYFEIIDAQNLNPLREWNISQELQQITKKLSEEEKKQIVQTNGYTNIAPTLKVLPDLLKKYGVKNSKINDELIKEKIKITTQLIKKEITKEQAKEKNLEINRKLGGNPIVLSEPIKIDGAKKQELSILNGIREMIKLENPNLKSITAEEFVNEAHNWLQTNYLLGFANENSHLSYRTDQTFQYLSDRQTNEDVDITNLTEEEIQRLPFEERQRIANIVGLTKQNPDVYHNKVSLRFNDMYHLKSGHFQKSPSAWGNLTYFYTGKNKWKDAVLLHEIQNDNIEFLREFKAEKVDLETSLGRYLQQLNTDLLDNITQIESGGKKITKKDIWSTNPPKQHLQLNYQLKQLKNLPLEQGLSQLKQNLNESIELYKSDNSVRTNVEKAQEAVDKAYSQRRIFQDFQKRGGIKSLLTKEELQNLEDILKRLNTEEVETATWSADDNVHFPDLGVRDLKQKKQDFNAKTIELQARITRELQKMYGDNAPLINLTAPAKPLPKSQRRNQIVNRGTPRERRIGNASQELNENVNFLIAFSEQQIIKQLSKNIEESKKNYIRARNATNTYNFNVSLSKITLEQWSNLVENYKYNEDLLDRLIDEQARKDIQKESIDISKLTDAEIKKDIRNGVFSKFAYKNIELDALTIEEAVDNVRELYDKNKSIFKQHQNFEALKQKALDKKAELEKNYGKIEEEVKQTLEIEMNYFTPLIHHLIQKHINQYGKDFPMYFSGYQITKLTQGNDRTAQIYAGKDEINIVTKNNFEYQKGAFYIVDDTNPAKIPRGFYKNGEIISQQEYEKAYQQATERRAKEIKFIAASQIGVVKFSDFEDTVQGLSEESNVKKLSDKQLEEGIKKLNEYKKQSKQNLDRVINTLMNISNSKPIETGAIYNAMTQISGVKLIWQDKIEGLKGNTGGYLVDLSNYNYNVPILYGLQNNKPQENNSFQQFQQSLNKPNTNPILQGNQQEQTKKFAELQERLNNKEFLEGAKNAYESSKELQQAAYEALGFGIEKVSKFPILNKQLAINTLKERVKELEKELLLTFEGKGKRSEFWINEDIRTWEKIIKTLENNDNVNVTNVFNNQNIGKDLSDKKGVEVFELETDNVLKVGVLFEKTVDVINAGKKVNSPRIHPFTEFHWYKNEFAAVATKAKGVPLKRGEKLTLTDIEKKNLYSDLAQIENAGLTIDISKHNNFYYSKGEGIHFIDLGAETITANEKNNNFFLDNFFENTSSVEYRKFKESFKPVAQITPQQKQQALEVYSQYLNTIFPDSKVEEMDNNLYISVLNQFEQENKIEKDCGGKLKAKDGMATLFEKGGKWEVITDFKNAPTHKSGGKDIFIQGKKVEVEKNELRIENDFGDVAVIPSKYRAKIQDAIKSNCHSCIDGIVESLPKMKDYAGDGTVFPFFGRYRRFKNSLPDNLKNTPESDYAMRYYWKHGNKPKSFDESINRENPMFTLEDDGFYHAPSVEPNTLRFLKPKNHPTLQYELDWYNSDNPDAVDFRSKYDLDTNGKFYRYVPKKQ